MKELSFQEQLEKKEEILKFLLFSIEIKRRKLLDYWTAKWIRSKDKNQNNIMALGLFGINILDELKKEIINLEN
ncbi:MAG: hypothetical protein AABY22_03905 [Nanoarchaeota archaeon]